MYNTLYQYYVIDSTHRDLRVECKENLGEQYKTLGLAAEERMTRRFELLLGMETPRIHPLEQIVLTRSVKNLPDVLTEDEWTEIKKNHYIHELGYVSNLSLDYGRVIASGLLAVRETADEYDPLSVCLSENENCIVSSDRYNCFHA